MFSPVPGVPGGASSLSLIGSIAGFTGIGLLAGRFAAAERLGRDIVTPPETTALGALLRHITVNADAKTFQPMNVNFGLFPEIESPEGLTKAQLREWKSGRKPRLSERALNDLQGWLSAA